MTASSTQAAVHLPAFLRGLTAGEVLAAAAALTALLVIGRMARVLGKLATVAATPVAAPASSSGGKGRLLLIAAAAGAGIWGYVKFRHPATATAVNAAPAPSPSPVPTVTQTIAPHVNVPVHLPLTGGQILIMVGIAAVVAIVLVGPLLRRSS